MKKMLLLILKFKELKKWKQNKIIKKNNKYAKKNTP